jgi:plastocyanin
VDDGAQAQRGIVRPMRDRGRRAALVSAVVATVLVVAGCGGGDGGEATDRAAGDEGVASPLPETPDGDVTDRTGEAEVVVQARDNTFLPQHLAVSPGTRITFDNRGRNDHNALPVEAGAFPDVPAEDLEPGETATIVIDEPGEYPYYCSLHGTTTAGMVGSIRVE